MHDRRIDGQTEVFGNAGALFKTAMTWYDHSTKSIWSQPWGLAIQGERTGTTLELLPSQVTTWASWREEHPETLVMTNGVGGFKLAPRERFYDGFVIGLVLGEEAKAYLFGDVRDASVINDHLGEFPILVWAQGDNFHSYLRRVGQQTLTFGWDGEHLVDEETGSSWDVGRGIALSGPLSGEALQQVPSLTAYEWSWIDFYPAAEIYDPES